MFDEINFRKIGFILALLGAGFYYAQTHIHIDDLFKYAKGRPVHDERARDIYYVGMVYWLKGDNEHAIEVFNTLLADETTTHYSPRALMRLGGCYRDMYRFAEAKAAYERYLEEFPQGEDIKIVQNNYDFVKFR